MEGVKVVVDEAQACTRCELCVLICPEFAIEVE
jgi:Pyruvate/2-oxoacid:ferredoxin oxidoreductase delta subunit